VGLLPTTVHANYELDPYTAQAVTSGPLGGVLDLDVRDGSLDRLRSGEVAMSQDLAAELDAAVGQQVAFRLGDGTSVSPTLVATFARGRGFGDAMLPMVDVVDHVTSVQLSSVLVEAEGAAAAVEPALAEFRAEHPTAHVGDRSAIRQAEDANAETQAWISYVLLGLVIVFVSLAVVNTLVLSTRDRAREFALLRLIGTTRRQVLRMMRWEALIVVSLGTVLGAGVAAATLAPFSKATTGSLMPSTPLAHVAVIVGSTLVVGLLGVLLPTRLAMRARPVDTIGMRQ
jgi:putative ABC transport system permease protein